MNSRNQLFILILVLLIQGPVFSQTAGDYRSSASGNWGSPGIWQRWSGSAWVAATNNDGYPGQFNIPGVVTILDGHTISLNITPSNSIGLFVVGEINGGAITTTGNRSLTVSNLTMNSGSSLNFTGNSNLTVTGIMSMGQNITFSFAGSATLTTTGSPSMTITSTFTYDNPHNLSLSNLTINPGASLTLSGTGDLSVSGPTAINGTFTDSNLTGANTFTGQVTISSTGSWTTTSVTNANIVFRGGLSNAGSFNAGAVTFNTNNQTIEGSNLNFSDITVPTGITLTNNGSISTGSIAGAGTFIQGANSTLNCTSNSGLSITTLDASALNNTINYSSSVSGSQNIFGNSYTNLILSGSTAKVLQTPITINGNFFIEGSTSLSSTQSIAINGDLSVTSSAGNPLSVPTVTFSGAGLQHITGSLTFTNFVLSKSGNLNLEGAGTTIVSGILTLNSGSIIPTSSHALLLGSSTTIAGTPSVSFVKGPLKKIMSASSTFSFPVGGNVTPNRYRPVVISNTNALDTWTVEYFDHNPSLDGYGTQTIGATSILETVSGFEYWIVTPANATTDADLTLSYASGSYGSANIGNVANLRIAHWDGLAWDVPAGNGVFSQNDNGSATAGTVSVTNVTSFSPVTLASTDIVSPLPVIWMNFTGSRTGHSIKLDWKTAQEWDNDYFEIERSADGEKFEPVGKVKGVGNSKVAQTYNFVDTETSSGKDYYYRLLQADYDGNTDYSKTIVVLRNAENRKRWIISPNPSSVSNQLQLTREDNLIQTETVKVSLITSSGQITFEDSGTLQGINLSLHKLLTQLKPGLYLLKISDGMSLEHHRVVVNY